VITYRTPEGIDAGLVLHIDGTQPLTPATVGAVAALCDRAEDRDGPALVLLQVSGTPGTAWTSELGVGLVNKWERALRRLERLRTTTVAVAAGDCGGAALDALLATDYRIAAPDVRLILAAQDGATWPGMAVYRLSQQAGVARIRRAVLFGFPIEAADALDLHLIDTIVDAADEAAGGPAVAAELAGLLTSPELAIRRQLMLDAATTSFEDALGSHLAACDRELRRTASDRPAAGAAV
jgi:isomerase DpgB